VSTQTSGDGAPGSTTALPASLLAKPWKHLKLNLAVELPLTEMGPDKRQVRASTPIQRFYESASGKQQRPQALLVLAIRE
jgi:hypothetical protein